MTDSQRLTLTSLPYDIRFLIYQHIFPSSPQIYLQVSQDGSIRPMIHDNVTTNIFLTCRAIRVDAAEYLYNNYLFNLIGTKMLCLRAHTRILDTLRKYAREDVQIHAFSNGIHSETMCISMHTGLGKTAILRRRRCGMEVTLREVRREIRPERGRSSRAWYKMQDIALGLVWSVAGLLVSLLQLFRLT